MANFDNLPSDGITSKTPERIMFGAGTIHKGLRFDKDTKEWNFKQSLLCATTGGSSVKFETEITEPEIDGAWVGVKKLKVKTGEKVTFELNPAEITADVLKMCLIGEDIPTDDDDFIEGWEGVRSTETIEAGHYIDDFAFVGRLMNGKPVIFLMDSCICTSGLELSSGNKDQVVPKATFEAVGDLDKSHRKLDWHIYYPKPTWLVGYDANGGSGELPEIKEIEDGKEVTLADGSGLTKEGFAFDKWNTKANGSGESIAPGTKYVPTDDTTFYAQ